jgi:hypothetical protein
MSITKSTSVVISYNVVTSKKKLAEHWAEGHGQAYFSSLSGVDICSE